MCKSPRQARGLFIECMRGLFTTILALFVALQINAQADTALLARHLRAVVNTTGFRNYTNTAALDAAAAYIKSVLAVYADTTFHQSYMVNGKQYRNVIARFRGANETRVIVGAHYDACEDQPGADDNASGVAGLLELARLLKGRAHHNTIELVAYTLEEPPFFRTPYMGSYVHAAALAARNEKVAGMISLEMIGFFSDEKGSQQYPLNFLKLIYGSRGDYITLVKKYGAGKFARRFGRQFIRSRQIKTKKFSGPRFLPGVDFSDHLNYWKFGYSALMITDTSFYRNKNYHEKGDTIATLDIGRMAKVIDATLAALLAL